MVMMTLLVVAYLLETFLLAEDLADDIFHDFSLFLSFPFLPLLQLCYLYSDLYKQTNSKETRRVFLEFHQFFLDRSAVSYQLILYNLCCSMLSYWTPTSSLPSPGFGFYFFGLSDVCTVSQLLITLDCYFYHF